MAKVCRSNNNPVVPASFFLKTISIYKLCPTIVRTDCGTENGSLAAIQCQLHDDEKAHQYGKSVTNQRIENWWSHLRRGYSNWVIDYFKTLVVDGIINTGNELHQDCIWFVYSMFLQNELDTVMDEWNNHYIRKSNDSQVSRIPNELFYLPEIRDFEECGMPVNDETIHNILEEKNFHEEEAA